MRILVDANRCQGHTLCAEAAPELFTLSDEDGHATATTDDVLESQRPAAALAVETCPERAIRILN
jgi:ferredoxin